MCHRTLQARIAPLVRVKVGTSGRAPSATDADPITSGAPMQPSAYRPELPPPRAEDADRADHRCRTQLRAGVARAGARPPGGHRPPGLDLSGGSHLPSGFCISLEPCFGDLLRRVPAFSGPPPRFDGLVHCDRGLGGLVNAAERRGPSAVTDVRQNTLLLGVRQRRLQVPRSGFGTLNVVLVPEGDSD